MKCSNGKRARIPTVVRKAELALQDAVADVVKEHRASGYPLAVWQDGKAVWLPASKVHLSVREPKPTYGKKRA